MSDENENPLDPIRYELKLICVKRSETEAELGWTLVEKPKALLIERVTEKSSIDAAGLASGDYVMSVNGRRTRKNSEMEEAVTKSPVNIRLIIARRRATPLDMNTMALPTGVERRLDREYHVFRLDQSSYPRVGIRVGILDGRMAVQSVDQSGTAAAYECGLRVGDRILTIGSARPRNEDHFRRILHVVQGDPVDFMVERYRRSPIAEPDLPNSTQSTTTTSSVPSTGVPDVPVDLEESLNKSRPNITKPISWKAAQDETKPKKTKHAAKQLDNKTGKRAKIKKPSVSQKKKSG